MLRRHLPADRRRGVILMVVLALLTLFAIVGITFAFYAQKSHTASVNFREAWQLGAQAQGADIDPNTLLAWALAQLIYDVPDDITGTGSALRGHSLSRNAYGYNTAGLNTQPFNGTGRLHYTSALSQDDYQLINYTYFSSDAFVRDPERYGTRATPAAAQAAPFTGGANAPYTYPDLNSFFLAAARADGTQLTQSFHRKWLFNANFALNDPANPNWTNPQGKYLTARPRPNDQLLPGETSIQQISPGQWVAIPTNRPIFPYPGDANGDVQNKIGAPGGNDSIWMDMGYPVMTAPDGTKFKPMFAWRVEDLDGKINVNVAGNLMGLNGGHASNQGWGKWEMSLAQLFNLNTSPTEWRNLFLGNATASLAGRYGNGPNSVPRLDGPNNYASNGKTPRYWGQVDFNGANEQAGGAATGPLQLPGGLSPFPTFPQGYSNGSQPLERTNHALLYDYFRPAGPTVPAPANWDDTVLPVSDIKNLIYSGASSSDVMNATVAQLCPLNFQNNPRLQGLVTTLSVDLNRMGLSPWLLNRDTPGSYLQPANLDQAPYGPAINFPTLTQRAQPVPANSDFRPDWRALDAALEKVDLNRTLPSYPHQIVPPPGQQTDYNSRFDTATAQPAFLIAQSARQQFASDIYKRLLSVTGTPAPLNRAVPTPAELEVRRWLAQLAVNIVDFIDEDEISTPFNFYGTADGLPAANLGDVRTNPATGDTTPTYWVFGTELPPVVLNEVLAEYKLPPTDAMGQYAAPNNTFNVQVFAELFTAIPSPPSTNPSLQTQDGQPIPFYIPGPGGAANGSYSVYDVVVADTAAGGPLFPDTTTGDNVLGIPNQIRSEAKFTTATTRTVGNANANAATGVNPAQGGFLLLGPPAPGNDAHNTIKPPPQGTVPGTTPWYQTPNMQYQVTLTPPGAWTASVPPAPLPSPINDQRAGVTVLLRRLANPHLPPDTRPVVGGAPNPLYNPYITVDYMEGVVPNDSTTNGYKSRGKRQPYASEAAQIQDQATAAGPIFHTLGQTNNPGPLGMPSKADWLVHLDRQLISPMELLQVSGFRPHLLTHKFILPNGTKFGQRVPWFDEDLAGMNPPQSHRLYRLFAFLENADRASGVSQYGRIPGKVNINTIWDPEVLLALLSPSASNYFTSADVATLWQTLLTTRTPGLPANPTAPNPSIGENDRPFLDPAASFLPAGDLQGQNRYGTIQDTIFRPFAANTPAGQRLFQPVGNPTVNSHPYLQYEMLTKLYNNVTTRSNVFGVWLTVGFFQVANDQTTPPKLGAEIGYPTTNIRHSFFAVVDRTQVVLAPSLTTGATAVPVPAPGPAPRPPYTNQTVTVTPKTAPTDALNGMNGTITYAGAAGIGNTVPWSIQPGSLLVIDRNTPNEEVVQVTQLVGAPGNPTGFIADFQREHTAGFSITMHGNPGPQSQFDPTAPAYAPVVPYYTVLQ